MRALGRNLTPAERDDIRLAAERVERWWDPGDPEDVAELVEALEDADYAYARDDGRYIAAVSPARVLSLLDEAASRAGEVIALKVQVAETNRVADELADRLRSSEARLVAAASREDGLRVALDNYTRTAEASVAKLRAERDDAQKRKDDAWEEVEWYRARMREANAELGSLRTIAGGYNAEVTRLIQRLEEERAEVRAAYGDVARLGRVIDATRETLTSDDFRGIHGRTLPEMAAATAQSRREWRDIAERAVDANTTLLCERWSANLAAGIAFAAAMREAETRTAVMGTAAAHAREAVAVADNERRSFSRRHSETRGWFSR